MLRDVDAGEFGVRIKVSRKYSFTMVRTRERCFSDTAGQELCQVGLVSVPRPRKSNLCNLWGGLNEDCPDARAQLWVFFSQD